MFRFVRLLALTVGLGSLVSWANAEEIRFIEDYALAKNRAESLKQLVPGTEDYYYFHCLHYQQTRIKYMQFVW